MGIIMSRIRRSWPTGSTCAGLASRRRGCWRWREDGSAATARSTSKAKIPSIGAGAATLATCRVTDVRLPSQFDGHLQPRRHTMVPTNFRSSGAAEFHRRALSEPDVNLSAHPAPSIQPYSNGFALVMRLLPSPVGRLPRQDTAVPSVQFHYRTFIPTTDCFRPCAPHRYSGSCRGLPLELLPSHRDDRFPRSATEPDPGSRRLQAGCRSGRASGLRPNSSRRPLPSLRFRHRPVNFGTSSAVRLRSSLRISPDGIKSRLFLRRSPPPLLTAAARSGLKPAPDRRLRGACPHLFCRSTPPLQSVCSRRTQWASLKFCLIDNHSAQWPGATICLSRSIVSERMVWVSAILALTVPGVVLVGYLNRRGSPGEQAKGIGWQFIRYTVLTIAIPIVGVLALNDALNGEAATLIAGAMGFAFGKASKDD